MKKFKNVIAMTLLATFVCGSAATMVGCGRDEYEERVNASKSQLIVSNYEGGFGGAWLDDVKTRFETAYAEKEYESGKKGAQILIDGNKTLGSSFSWAKTNAQVAFTEQMSTEYFATMVAKGEVIELGDVMDTILAQTNVSLGDNVLNTLRALDGKIYQIPHYEGGGGVIYDRDLFDENSLYVSATGGWTNASGNLSAGPDGKTGTMDDGLPATYEQFFKLCKRMKQNSITPFMISGEWKTAYAPFLLDSVWLAYDGRASAEAVMDVDGDEITYVTEITENTDGYFGYDVKTAKTNITKDNGYLKEQTPGRLYAFEMLQEIIEEKYYDETGWASTISHLDAQEMFLKSLKMNAPIAMLIDGTWWENEATDVFDRMSATNAQYSKKNRNFGWMSLPTKVNDNDINVQTSGQAIRDTMAAFAMVRSGLSAAQEELAKDFLKFCYTEAELEAFTVKTGTTRPFSYNLSETSYNSLTTYQKEMWALHLNGSFIYPSASKFYIENTSKVYTDIWDSEYRGSALMTFSTKGNTVSAAKFFKEFWMTEEKWNEKVKK